MDDLLNWLDQRTKYKEDQKSIEATYKQNTNSAVKKPLSQPNWRQQNNNLGKSTKQPTLRDIVMQQFRINNNINAKLVVNDKILEDINVKINNFSSAINDQLAYNKKIESKLAQLAVVLFVATNPE
jgi:hypothetical protein